MSAAQDTRELMRDLERAGIELGYNDANTLRRAQITLRRWAGLECGDSDDWKSWAIERDETTGVPYMRVYSHQRGAEVSCDADPCTCPDGPRTWRYRIPDREAGALRRVADVCGRNGIHYYHQTDPRGSALRISREPLTYRDYTRGVAV